MRALICAALAVGMAGCSGGFGAEDRKDEVQVFTATAFAPPVCAPADCTTVGGFSEPFAESEALLGTSTTANHITPGNPLNSPSDDGRCIVDENGIEHCKPAAGSIALLPDGRLLYFNALEGTENVEYSIFFEAGHAIINDQTRVMTLDAGPSWVQPTPLDAGANPDGGTPTTILPPGIIDNAGGRANNSGALFCADLSHLPDGRVLAVGGTDYYAEPGINTPIPVGVSELEGLRNARLFDPRDNTWVKTGDMTYGRWYPTVVTLPTGDVMVASGVTKLVKPVYPERPLASGTNVTETETYDLGCGTWSENGAAGARSLPLFPRLHLLPNGHVLYNAAGQAFNPFGQAYDQALWNLAASYDPAAKQWSVLGLAGLPLTPGAPDANSANLLPGAGFRGSTFSILLPLAPDPETGVYDRAEILTAGGVLGGLTFASPGSYIAIPLSRVDSVDMEGASMSYTTRLTGPLNAARWYGTGVLLPTGEVMVFSGADRDEVALPGTGTPQLTTELFDPATETWRTMAQQGRPRTYHNTALLLPDGRVLVGGHAPINTLYAYSITLPGMSPNDGRDPSFEVYSPPYVFGQRPRIDAAPAEVSHGERIAIVTPDAALVDSVVLVRRTDITHLLDADQRTVVLPIVARTADRLEVTVPLEKAVLPPGQYMLFVVAPGEFGRAPSLSAPVAVTGADTGC